jgi:cytoskeletal protein CcmA (bactofilin family)
MSMWGPRRRYQSTKVDTLIGRQTVITGDVRFSAGLHVEGRVIGNVIAEDPQSKAVLILSETGVIEGEVRVPNMVINGVVAGDVYATGHMELASRARVMGSVYYRLMEMAAGAEVNGNLEFRKDEVPQHDPHGIGSVVDEGRTVVEEVLPAGHDS